MALWLTKFVGRGSFTNAVKSVKLKILDQGREAAEYKFVLQLLSQIIRDDKLTAKMYLDAP